LLYHFNSIERYTAACAFDKTSTVSLVSVGIFSIISSAQSKLAPGKKGTTQLMTRKEGSINVTVYNSRTKHRSV